MNNKAGKKTRDRILTAGITRWPDITLETIASECNMTRAAILYHFPRKTLKDAIANYAVEIGHSSIIVQLIALKHPAVSGLTQDERAHHMFALS